MDDLFIFGANYLYFLVLILAGIYFIRQPREVQKKIASFSAISVVFIYLAAIIAGHVYFDPRPFVVGNFTPLIPHLPDNGFPSDHVLLVSAVAASVMYFSRRLGFALWIITIFIAISRVYAGVHHVIDVVGSILMSLIVTFLVHSLKRNYTHKSPQ